MSDSVYIVDFYCYLTIVASFTAYKKSHVYQRLIVCHDGC